jgi:heme-binding protein
MLPRVRLFLRLLILLGIVLLAAQLIPYGRDHTNPRTVQELEWNSPATRSLAESACFDCHSNLTEWPWYTNVAPISWLTERDVEDGRAELNFSEWQRPQEADLQDVIDAIRGNDMPPFQYRAIHADARLSDAEKQDLERGIVTSWTRDPPGQ